jgi:hypothetical protein
MPIYLCVYISFGMSLSLAVFSVDDGRVSLPRPFFRGPDPSMSPHRNFRPHIFLRFGHPTPTQWTCYVTLLLSTDDCIHTQLTRLHSLYAFILGGPCPSLHGRRGCMSVARVTIQYHDRMDYGMFIFPLIAP